MKQSFVLAFLGIAFLTSCASTKPEETPQTNNISIYNVSVESSKAKSGSSSECDALLDECALVVEQQHVAIEEQKKLVNLQSEQIKVEQQAKEQAESAKSKSVLLNIVQGVAIFLLILL